MTTSQESPHPNSRWKWMAGSVAAATATSSSLAGTVQITLNQQLSSDGTGGLSSDITNDGIPDLPGLSTFFNSGTRQPAGVGYGMFYNSAAAKSSGADILLAKFTSRYATAGSTRISATYSVLAWPTTTGDSVPTSQRGLYPVAFSDTRINGGVLTEGRLELFASSAGPLSNTIQFVRLVFDDSSTTAPEDVESGETNAEFVPSVPEDDLVLKSQLLRKIKALQKKIRRAKKAGNTVKARKLTKKLKKLKRQLSAL